MTFQRPKQKDKPDNYSVDSKLNIPLAFNALGVADSSMGQSLAACNGVEDLRLKDDKVLNDKQILYIPETDTETINKIQEIKDNNPGRIEKNSFLEIVNRDYKRSEDIWIFFYDRGYIGDNFRGTQEIIPENEKELELELEKKFKGLGKTIVTSFKRLHPGFEIKVLPKDFRKNVSNLSDEEWLNYEHGSLYLKEVFNLSCTRTSRGRFGSEMYYWDSFPYVLSLSDENKIDEAKNLVRNFFYQLEHYGMVLNGNRTYYFGRSQPPLLSSMVRAIFDHQMQVNKDPDDAHEWLYESLEYLKTEYKQVWEKYALVQIGDSPNDKLAHYFDHFNKVSPEAIGEKGYAERCFGPPVECHQFTEPAYRELFITIKDKKFFKRKVTIEQVRSKENEELLLLYTRIQKDSLLEYRHDLAERSSGTDMCQAAFESQCADILPVCLNTLIYKLLNDLAFITAELPNKGDEHEEWTHKAAHLRRTIKKHLYDPKTGLYRNKNYKTEEFTKDPFITIVYPLTFNLASASEARTIAKYIIENHLTPYGIKNVNQPHKDQWDHIWAIMNYFVNKGFRLYGSQKITVHGKENSLSDWAREIATRYVNHLAFMNERTGTFHEKLNAIDGSYKFKHEHYGNMEQFTWTAAVFISLLKRIRSGE